MNRFLAWSRARRSIVSPGAFAALFLALVCGCVTAQPAFAAAHLTVYVQPFGVDLSTQGAMAVGEVVPVEVRGALADAQVTNWLGAVTRGTNVVAICTNLVMATNGVAVGSVDCATAEMGALFVGAGPLAERDVMLTFAEKFNDAGDYRLVASGSATVRNNPLSADAIAGFAPTGRHLWDSPLFDAIRDWIKEEYTTAISAHVSDTNNPHNVTAAQLGALTAESDPLALPAIQAASNALSSALSAHVSDTHNPHRVTLEQLNQSDELGTLLFAYGINAWLNEGLKYISWTDHRVDLEHGTFYGAWNFSTYPPSYEGAKLLTTNDIAPSFTNGTAPSLILSGIPFARFIDSEFRTLAGIFYFSELYNQLAIKPAGETASVLTLAEDTAQFSKDLRVLQNLSADSFTLDGSTNKLEVLDGDLTYGGEPIGNGQGSGFPLTNNADFASYSATNVGSIQLAGSTNELAVVDGKLKYGGRSVSGIHNLEAGANIQLSTNTETEVVTIATTDDVSFGDVEVAGNLTLANEQIDSWDDISYTRQTTIYATNWYTVQTNIYNYTTNIYNAPISNTYYTTQVTYTNCNITNTHYHTTVSNSYWADTLYTSNYYADRVVQPMIWLTNGTIALQPDVQIYAATPDSGTIFEVDLSALDAPPSCAITFEMLLDLGAATSNVTFMSTNTLSWLEGDAPAIPQGARSILVFRSYDLTNWIANLQGTLP